MYVALWHQQKSEYKMTVNKNNLIMNTNLNLVFVINQSWKIDKRCPEFESEIWLFIGLACIRYSESDVILLHVVLTEGLCTRCDTLRLVGHRTFYLTTSVVYDFFKSEHSKLYNSSSMVWDETTLDQVICEQSGSNGCVILGIAAYQYQTLCYFLWFSWRQFIIIWWLFKHKLS